MDKKSLVDAVLQEDTFMHFSDFDMNPKIEDTERSVVHSIETSFNLIVGSVAL